MKTPFRPQIVGILLVLLLGIVSASHAQSTTIRIRLANGKNSRPLRLKFYEHGIGTGFNAGDYKIERVENDSLIVTFNGVSSFRFRSAGFEPCDVKRRRDEQPRYDLNQVLEKGVVAPNFCGATSAKPVPGELLIYSRHEHWWEISKRIAQGLLICG